MKNSQNKTIGALFILFAVCVVFCCGCAGAQKRTYKIGLILPLSGIAPDDVKAHAVAQKAAALSLADEINGKGGINGSAVELIIEDSGGDRAKALLAAKKLLEIDYVSAAVFPGWGGMSISVSRVFANAVTPLIYNDYRGDGGNFDNNIFIRPLFKRANNSDPDPAKMRSILERDITESLKIIFEAIEESGRDKSRIGKNIGKRISAPAPDAGYQ